MKKSVLIVIGIIYVVAIVAINLFGMKVSVYNQKINVTEIICTNKTDESNGVTVGEYVKADGSKGMLITIIFTKRANKDTMQGTMLQLSTRVLPDNATNKELEYSVYQNDKIEFYTDGNDKQTGLILFYEPTVFDLMMRTTDNSNVSLTVRIRAVAESVA